MKYINTYVKKMKLYYDVSAVKKKQRIYTA